MIDFSHYPLAAIFAVSTAALFVACEIGHCFGRRSAGEANVAPIEASLLGLLALMLGFTFSFAVARFEERRQSLLDESNAIGTAALRAVLLPRPHDSASLQLFGEYARTRLEIAAGSASSQAMDAEIARSSELQRALWIEAKAVLAKDNSMAPTGLYIQALNDVFDNQAKHSVAIATHVPDIVLLSLYGVSTLAIGFAAYASGLERRRWRSPVYLTASLASGVILLIQDIDRPDAGFVAISRQPLSDIVGAIAGLKKIPDSGASSSGVTAPVETEMRDRTPAPKRAKSK